MNQYTKNTRMNPESDNDELTIDLTEVIGALLKKAHIIILTGIIVALLAFIGTKLFITPMYTAETKVYVLSKSDGSSRNFGNRFTGWFIFDKGLHRTGKEPYSDGTGYRSIKPGCET